MSFFGITKLFNTDFLKEIMMNSTDKKPDILVTGTSTAVSHVICGILLRSEFAIKAQMCDYEKADRFAIIADCVIINNLLAPDDFSLSQALKNIPVILITSNENILSDPEKYGLFAAIKNSSGGTEGLQVFSDNLIKLIGDIANGNASQPKETVSHLTAVYDEVTEEAVVTAAEDKTEEIPTVFYPDTVEQSGKIKLIAIGASTGGTDAIVEVVQNLPANTPPVVIVQHMPEGFTQMYAERLDRICKMSAKEAEDGDRLREGLIILAHGGRQMQVHKDSIGYYISSKPGERVSGHCPSVDHMFRSVAKICGEDAIGVILTGMGRDGAYGIKEMRDKGSYTIGQDSDSCVVYGMPKVAYEEGGVVKQAPLKDICSIIIDKLK